MVVRGRVLGLRLVVKSCGVSTHDRGSPPPFAFLVGTIFHYTTAPLVKVIAVTKQSAQAS